MIFIIVIWMLIRQPHRLHIYNEVKKNQRHTTNIKPNMILPWRRSVWQTKILVIFIYIFIHIWFLVSCVVLILLHFIPGHVYTPNKILMCPQLQGLIGTKMDFTFIYIVSLYCPSCNTSQFQYIIPQNKTFGIYN